jgi:hypothetical protein
VVRSHFKTDFGVVLNQPGELKLGKNYPPFSKGDFKNQTQTVFWSKKKRIETLKEVLQQVLVRLSRPVRNLLKFGIYPDRCAIQVLKMAADGNRPAFCRPAAVVRATRRLTDPQPRPLFLTS